MTDKRVAVVTGSSSGIGTAVARRLAAEGIRVVINSARSRTAGQQLAESLPEAIYVQADVSDGQQAAHLIDTTVETFGRLDILVNNAGRTRLIPHHELTSVTTEIWQEILALNVVGTWQTAVAAVPHLKMSGAGCIVNISSVAGSRPAGSSIPYAVSKAAVEHMTRLLANVLGPEVRVNAVAPGLIDTPWTREFTQIAEKVRESTPLRRVGTPEDIAEAVYSMVNVAYMTGQVVLVDGGAHLI